MNINSKYILAAISGLLVLFLLWYFNQLVMYIVMAWVLSMVGAPIYNFFNRWLGRPASAGLTLGVFSIVLILLFLIFVPPLVKQARNLAGIDYNKVLQGLEEPIEDINAWMIKRGFKEDTAILNDANQVADNNENLEDYVEAIALDSLLQNGDTTGITLLININPTEKFSEKNQQIAPEEDDLLYLLKSKFLSLFDPSKITKFFGSAFGFMSSILVAFMSVMFIAFFFLKEQGLFLRMVSALIPDEFESNASNALSESSGLLIRYFIGVLTQISAITLIVSVVLTILGVKNALLIGLFAAAMNVIPYIGPFFGMGFAALITISSNVDLPFYQEVTPILIKVIIVLFIVQMLDNFILQPTIFSKSVKAHPLEIFLIVLVGAQLGGVLGMVLAIPAYTVFRVLGKVFFSEYKIVQRITKGI